MPAPSAWQLQALARIFQPKNVMQYPG